MEAHPVILFDGVCNFCNGAVNFIIQQDTKGLFRLAALQSDAAQQLLEQHHLSKYDFKSFVLIMNGKVYQRSTAALKTFNQFSWHWKWTQAFWIVPRFIRDAVYDLLAKNRYKWFGKKDQCRVPTPDVRSRFL